MIIVFCIVKNTRNMLVVTNASLNFFTLCLCVKQPIINYYSFYSGSTEISTLNSYIETQEK